MLKVGFRIWALITATKRQTFFIVNCNVLNDISANSITAKPNVYMLEVSAFILVNKLFFNDCLGLKGNQFRATNPCRIFIITDYEELIYLCIALSEDSRPYNDFLINWKIVESKNYRLVVSDRNEFNQV